MIIFCGMTIPTNLWYILIIIAIAAICYGIVYLYRKFKITPDEKALIKLIAQTTKYANKQFEYKNKERVSLVIDYTCQALFLIDNFEELKTQQEKKELIKAKALEICKKNNVEPDTETIEIVGDVCDYLATLKIKTK